MCPYHYVLPPLSAAVLVAQCWNVLCVCVPVRPSVCVCPCVSISVCYFVALIRPQGYWLAVSEAPQNKARAGVLLPQRSVIP